MRSFAALRTTVFALLATLAGLATAAAQAGLCGGGRVVAVVSGGNIDLAKFAALVGACGEP